VFSIQLSENDDFIPHPDTDFQNISNHLGGIHDALDDTFTTPRPSICEPIVLNDICNEVHSQEFNKAKCTASPSSPTAEGAASKKNVDSFEEPKRVSIKSMAQARCAIGAVFLNGHIVVFGW
jgi:formate-dependent nitrite reductase cytochrome c552 subunit